MSWQAYVDSTLLGSGKVNAAAIFSAAGDSVWATSAGFAVMPEEIKLLATAFGDGSKVPELPSPGFHIGGVKYITIKCEEKKSTENREKLASFVLEQHKPSSLLTTARISNPDRQRAQLKPSPNTYAGWGTEYHTGFCLRGSWKVGGVWRGRRGCSLATKSRIVELCFQII